MTVFFSFTLYVFVPICPCSLSYCHIFLLTWVIRVTCLVRGHLEAFFMLWIGHPSVTANAYVNNFHHENTSWGTWKKGKQFGNSEKAVVQPNASFLSLFLCWNDRERWWMTDTTLKCLLSFRIILPIFR